MLVAYDFVRLQFFHAIEIMDSRTTPLPSFIFETDIQEMHPFRKGSDIQLLGECPIAFPSLATGIIRIEPILVADNLIRFFHRLMIKIMDSRTAPLPPRVPKTDIQQMHALRKMRHIHLLRELPDTIALFLSIKIRIKPIFIGL